MVKIYSIEGCTYCAEIKKLLNEANIEYVDIDVNKPENEQEFNKIYQKTKSDSVPIIRVGKQLFVPEISFKSINEAFHLVKKFL